MPGGTARLPSGLKLRPATPPLLSRVGSTSAGAKLAPLRVSLPSTLGVLPPARGTGVPLKSSSTASMAQAPCTKLRSQVPMSAVLPLTTTRDTACPLAGMSR